MFDNHSVRGGDESAAAQTRERFESLVLPEIPTLLRVGQVLTGSTADAEDVVQETLIRAYRFLHTFDGRHPRAWLLAILRNATQNVRRKSFPVLIDNWDQINEISPVFGPSDTHSPEVILVDPLLGNELASAVNSLSLKYREAVVLVDVEGLSYAECSDALGIPIGTVMSRLNRGRRQIREFLKDAGWSR